MAEILAPISIDSNYAVETIDHTTGEIRESYHYETYEKAQERYERVKNKDTLIVLALYTEIIRLDSDYTFHKLVLAKNM